MELLDPSCDREDYKMDTEEVLREFNDLPPSAQQEVVDFIAFLRQRYASRTTVPPPPLIDEPFIGMWSGRTDMGDSTEWVRTARAREWG